ncbi:aspartic peptidase domain-containing protein [Cyathus striatus]|nr:aspartic peptidase domain-containing protein [Cyathus striatus]
MSRPCFMHESVKRVVHNHSQLLASVGNDLGLINVAGSYTTIVSVNGKLIPGYWEYGFMFENTEISLNLQYGDGSYGVQGTIGVAPFEFGNFTIERQAFLYVNKNTITGIIDIGLHGLFGLGLDTRGASPIKMKTASIPGKDRSWGAAVSENIFNQHPTQPNSIGFDLDGSFTIGEYDENYAAIGQVPKLPQFPLNSDRSTSLVDAISANGKSILLSSSISKAHKNRAVALLDTGAPNTIFPVDVLDAILSQFPSAVNFAQEGEEVAWIVPCNATALLNFNFSGVEVPIHPLDMSVVYKDVNLFGQNYTFCMSSPGGRDGCSKDFDMMLGDDFLRNVYSIYDFGNSQSNGTSGEPYMQLLAKTNFDKTKDHTGSINQASVRNMAKTYVRVVVGLLSANLFIGVVLVLLDVGNYVCASPRPDIYLSQER